MSSEPPVHLPSAPKSLAGILLRPTLPIILVALSLTCLLLRLYVKNRRRRATSSTAIPPSAEPRSSGLNRTAVDSLPFFRFGSVQGQKEGADCAVCLAKFEPAELLRLLPKCRHAFHVECADAWLELHSACPLCRSRVCPEDAFLVTGGAGDRYERNSLRGEGASCEAGGRERKDGLLLPGSHRVILAGGERMRERWSDLRAEDLMFMRMEGGIGSRRSESGVGFDRRVEVERTRRKWLGGR